MGVRGPKPKPTHLHLVTGSLRADRHDPVGEPDPGGRPVRPGWLRAKRAAELWDEIMAFAFWLTRADTYKLAAWCDRQAQFERAQERKGWTAADRREHRSLGSELGLDPASRARLGHSGGGKVSKTPTSRFFGDK